MCEFPIHIRNKEFNENSRNMAILNNAPNYYYHRVPCGKCKICLDKRADSWLVRLKYHLKDCYSSYFVTMTYVNPPLSYNELYTAQKSDLQKFFKRLRDREKGNNNIKYYAVSEYGEKYERPHYHAIIFNVNEVRNITKAWTINNELIGHVDIGTVTPASIRYVSGYIGKKIGIPKSDYDDRLPEFSLMSKGLGLNLLDYSGDYLKETLTPYVFIDQRKYPLPRYIKDKLFTPLEKEQITKLKLQHYENQQLKTQNSLHEAGYTKFDFVQNRHASLQNNASNKFINDKII